PECRMVQATRQSDPGAADCRLHGADRRGQGSRPGASTQLFPPWGRISKAAGLRQSDSRLQRWSRARFRHATAFYGRALAYEGKKDPDRDIKDYDAAIRLDPGHVTAFSHRAAQH